MQKAVHFFLTAWLMAAGAGAASGQISLASAVGLALQSSPRVQLAQADVRKAAGALREARAAYIPSLTVGSGLGYSYGYPLGQPSVVNVTTQSLLFSYSQRDYIRAAQDGLRAASLSLQDTRQGVEADTVDGYLALDHDVQRQAALEQELAFAGHLVDIVRDRLNAGQDTALTLTQARLTDAQIRLAALQAEDQTTLDRQALARLTGLPAASLSTAPDTVPGFDQQPLAPAAPLPDTPAVQAAFANAEAKLHQSFGDARHVHRPEVYLASQYSLFAKFNNYQEYFPAGTFQYNNAGIGIQINWPIFDARRSAEAEQSAAEAAHAEAQARVAQSQQQAGETRLEHSIAELAARYDVADLEQQVARQQLAALRIQLQAGAAATGGQQMTPKDEANAEISERQKYVDLLDARIQLLKARIQLLRQTGGLDAWLQRAGSQPATAPSGSVSHP